MTQDPGRGAHRLLVLFLLLCGLAAWAPSLGVYFLKDDLNLHVLTGGGHGFDFESWWTNLVIPTARTHDDIFRPVPPLTWAVDYLVFGPDPWAFHLWNVFVHCLNGVLIYWLVNRLTGFRSPLAGFFAGLLFVLYPLHGEAVLWSTQRFVVLGLALSLLTLLFWDRWLHRRGRGDLLLTFLAMTACTLTKEIGVTLPAGLVVMALVLGPPRPLGRRVRDAALAAAVGALIIGAYFGARLLIFGRLTGGYSGWPTMQEYARANMIFERLPRSLLHCAVPVNRALDSLPAVTPWILGGLQAAAVLLAGIRLLNASIEWPRARGLVLLGATVAATALVPTLWIFQVGPDLINGRFGYHPIAFPIILLAVFLVDPWSPRRTGAATLRGSVLPASGLAVAYAVVLQANLGAYDLGGAQVRLLQEALVHEAERDGHETVYAVFGVPHELRGCPTVDAYLPLLTRPPLTRRPVLSFPFVQSLESGWPRRLDGPGETLMALRRAGRPPGDLRPVRYLRARAWPVGLVPLFGATEPARGDLPVEPLEPADGAAVVNPGPEPVFVFTAPEGVRHFRFHLDVPGATASWSLELRLNAPLRDDGKVTWSFSLGGAAGEAPDPWAGLATTGPPTDPLPALWRVESLDERGNSVGVSRSMRLLVVDAPKRRP